MRILRGSGAALCRGWFSVFLASCVPYAPGAELWPSLDGATAPQGTSATGGGSADAGPAAVGSSGGNGSSTGAMTGSGAPSGNSGASSGNISGASAGGSGGSGAGAQDAGGMTSGASSGSPGGPVDAGSAGSGRTCSLSVTVTTVTVNGNYSPRNIGAIWIARGSGTFVKTLAVWARQRIGHLTLWNSATRAAGLGSNTVDAVTGATLSTHQTHQVSWNCTDAARTLVPDGPYRAYFEMTDDNVSGPNMFVDFTKGSMAFALTPADAAYFKGIKLVFTP